MAFEYKDGILNIYKTKDADIEIDVLKDKIDSYEKYKNETIQRDINYLCYAIMDVVYKGNATVTAKVHVGPKEPPNSEREISSISRSEYHRVTVDFYVNGHTAVTDVPLMFLPYMNDLCVFNFDGKKKTIINVMRRAEDISYIRKRSDSSMVVNMPENFFSFSLYDRNRRIAMTFRGERLDLNSLMHALSEKDNVQVDEYDIFANAYAKATFQDGSLVPDFQRKHNLANNVKMSCLVQGYGGVSSKVMDSKGILGPLRNNLNTRLSFESAIGQTLSRPIGHNGIYVPAGQVVTDKLYWDLVDNGVTHVWIECYGVETEATVQEARNYKLSRPVNTDTTTIPAGTEITADIVRKIRKLRCNEIYVKHVPTEIIGLKTSCKFTYNKIPAGSRITDLVKSLVPELEDSVDILTYKDYYIDEHVIPAKTVLTRDIVQLLYDCGFSYVSCELGKQVIRFTFEQEFIGNYTARAIDLVDDITQLPDDVAGTDWIYYYGMNNISELSERKCSPDDHLTYFDMLGMISLAGRLLAGDIYKEGYDVDLDFCKKIDMVNETFSKAFRATVDTVVAKYATPIRKLLNNQAKDKGLPFMSFYKLWKKYLLDASLLRDSKDQTPLNILTQANKIVTPKSDPRAVADSQRMMSLGFYGKIDPYEVPQGKNIGIVNTMTACTRIIDGIMYTPYLPIIKRSGKCYISYDKNDIKWFNAEDERKYIIGDKDLIHLNSDGSILKELVMARVPADMDEKSKVKSVYSTDLDFVNALGEQTLSPGVQVITHACSDDAVRLNFGDSLIQNSIYLQDGQIPFVLTSMYKHMYSYGGNDFTVTAEDDGYVVDVERNKITVQYKGRTSPTSYILCETKILNTCVINMSYRKMVGESFKRGEILADTPVSSDGVFSPGCNVLIAQLCWEGYNYEDALVYSKSTAYKFISVGNHKIVRPTSNKYYELPRRDNDQKYIPKNGVIDTIVKTAKDKNISTTGEWKSGEASGILYYEGTEHSTSMMKSGERDIVAKLLSFNKLQVGDKVAGRHGNKGVVARLEENSNMATLFNGQIIEVVANPLGIGSRMNIGQIDETLLGLPGYLIDMHICSNSFNGATIEDIHLLQKFVYDVANAEINDDYMRSFYKTNSRVMIETTKRVGLLITDIKECSDKCVQLSGALGLLNIHDIGTTYKEVTAAIERIGSGSPIWTEAMQLRYTLSDIVLNIETIYSNLYDGLAELLNLLGNVNNLTAKELKNSWERAENSKNLSDTQKKMNKLNAVFKYFRKIAMDSIKDIVDNYSTLPNEVLEAAVARFWFIKDYEDCFFSDGTALLYNPETGLPYEGHVTIGVSYFLKIVQEVDEKVGARAGALTEKYSALEHQPPQGAARGGGQRTGEMELSALLAFGAAELIYEVYNICSDNDGERARALCKALGITDAFIEDVQCHPRTVDLFRYILEGLNVGVNITNYPSLDKKTIAKYKNYKGLGLFSYYLDKTKDISDENQLQAVLSESPLKDFDSQFSTENLTDDDWGD